MQNEKYAVRHRNIGCTESKQGLVVHRWLLHTIWWRDGAETWAPLEQFELKEGREGKGRRGVECRVEWESLEWTYIWPCDWPANVCDPVGNFMEWKRQNVREREDDACRSYGLEW